MYKIRNESGAVRTMYTDNGRRVKFEPGEQKRLRSRPPRDENLWTVEEIDEEQSETTEDDEEEGGEN